MSTNPFTLAALATTAVEGLDLVAAVDDGSDASRSVVAARLANGDTVQVVLPRSVRALEAARAHVRALAALTPATRARLPFDVPNVIGETGVGKSAIFVLSRLGGDTMRLSDISPARLGLAESVGKATAAIHELPTSVVADAGLEHATAAALRQRVLDVFDKAAATGRVPAPLLERWETAANDDRLWQFKPAVVHGDLQAAAFRVEGTQVVGVDGWHRLAIGDPARDLAFLLGSSEFGSVDEAFEAHASARGIGDRHVRQRAMLYAELDVAGWMLHGLETDDASIVEDAKRMLDSLLRRVDHDPGAAIAPARMETMDLTGVQEYLGTADQAATGAVPSARPAAARSGEDPDDAGQPRSGSAARD